MLIARVGSLLKIFDTVDFKKSDRGLRLPVHMKDLLLDSLGGPICVASAVLAVIGYDNELEHVVMQGLSHLVKRSHIRIQGWYGQDIRLIPEGGDYFQIGCVVTNGAGQHQGAAVFIC